MSSVFEDLVGQEHIIGILQSAAIAAQLGSESQEMSHAWLFTGPPGSGRSSAAIAFAQALVCTGNGCGECLDCQSARTGGHPDVEIIRTEGLSIKVEEIRELLTRVAWAPSLAAWRTVVIEDIDRLTESAASALLKAIEEPGSRTVWLLCAPTLHDVLPTIRSRSRHLQLRTPSVTAVAQVLINSDKIEPKLAEFAARVSQGHIGRARYLATNETARKNRETIMQIPFQLGSLSSALQAAQTLVDIATGEAKAATDTLDESEKEILEAAYGKGSTGRGMATGGSKAVKELEKDQKARTTRAIRDSIDWALLDLATFYRDLMMIQSGIERVFINCELEPQLEAQSLKSNPASTIQKMDTILKTRTQLIFNSAPLPACEALMCSLAKP